MITTRITCDQCQTEVPASDARTRINVELGQKAGVTGETDVLISQVPIAGVASLQFCSPTCLRSFMVKVAP